MISFENKAAARKNMRFTLLFGLVALVVLLDQFAARLVDQNARGFDPSTGPVLSPLPSVEELDSGVYSICQNSSMYLIYRYQYCYKAYTSGASASDDGWHLVYHKPKPWLTIIMPARRPDSFYFEETVQGEFVLFVRRDGKIVLGDQR